MTAVGTTEPALHYRPWVGAHYENPQSGLVPPGVRLLVMGESVYGDDEWVTQPDFAQNMVTWRVFKQDWRKDRFFFGITRCFAPLGWDDPRFKAVWRDIAFWEYVQEPLAGHTRAPSTRQFERGHAAFEEVVADLRPTHVWAISRRLWDNMTDVDATACDGEATGDATVDGNGSFGCYRYRRASGDFLVWGTYHPSRPQFFDAELVRPCLKAFLSRRA